MYSRAVASQLAASVGRSLRATPPVEVALKRGEDAEGRGVHCHYLYLRRLGRLAVPGVPVRFGGVTGEWKGVQLSLRLAWSPRGGQRT